MHKKIVLILLLAIFISNLLSYEKFYNYYDKGLEFMEKGDWLRAIEEFKSAISLEYEDTKQKRTYGTRFIKYFPHREMGIALFNLGEYNLAKEEIQLSYEYKKSKRAKKYLDKLQTGELPDADEVALAELVKIDEEKERIKKEQEELRLKKLEEKKAEAERKKIEKRQKELEKERIRIEKERKKKLAQTKKNSKSGLAYDASKVTQVGSRLSLAVMPFEAEKEGNVTGKAVSEKMINQLVNMRRFRVVERSAMEKVMEEQAFALSGMVDEETAVEVGKLVGADMILLGSVNVSDGFSKVHARGIDTETSETLIAQEASSSESNEESIELLIENVAIRIYNSLPLVEGYVVKVDDEAVYLDLGANHGVLKGTKCIAYKEGEDIIHPKTKKILGRKVKKCGDLTIVQVQEEMSIAIITEKISDIKQGDRVVVK